MQLPLQILFRYMEPSGGVEARLRKEADELKPHHENIMACRIIVEEPHAHHHQGRLYGDGREIYFNRRGVLAFDSDMVHIQK